MLRAFQQSKSASIWLADLGKRPVVKLNQSDQMKYAQLKAKRGKSARRSAGKVDMRAREKWRYTNTLVIVRNFFYLVGLKIKFL